MCRIQMSPAGPVMSPPSSPLPPTPDDDIEEDHSGAIPCNPQPGAGSSASASTCGVSVPGRTVASQGSTPAWPKRGRKAGAASKYEQSWRKGVDEHSDNEIGNPKQFIRGDTRPTRPSVSSHAMELGLSISVRVVWTSSLSVRWDASRGIFSLSPRWSFAVAPAAARG